MLCLNESDHKNTMFFKDLGALSLKNRKIGFGKVLFKTLSGGQNAMPKTAIQTFSFLAIFPVELNGCLRIKSIFHFNSRGAKILDDAVSFRFQGFEDMNGSVGIFFDIVLFAVSKK